MGSEARMRTELAVEREVLARFRSGEGQAFTEVMRAYAGLVRAVSRGFFRDAFRQEEAMQEIWLLAYHQRERLDPERLDEFEGWLRVLARRRCIDLLRRERRIQARETSQDPGQLGERAAVPAEQPGQLELAEVQAALQEFQARLRPAWRAFFELCFIQGKDCAEAARQLALGRIRCKYMKRVLAARARRSPRLRRVLGLDVGAGGAPHV
ncbi:MAG TPA: sigma-70 family RNA polymerase sigma factor [Myxococcota bacterium]|nr:sigma-70 family RNA polymerase sigma factor [Myxococcota bacterium]HRY96568.1 sigma-70 family RNA polymerase sigma factor [Myxococcota bacterium]